MRLRFIRNQLLPYQTSLLHAIDILQRPDHPRWRPNYLSVKRLIAAHGKQWRRHAGETLAGWALNQAKKIPRGALPVHHKVLIRRERMI